MPEATVALCAAPNTGKTTLFNRLTGANQTVGNWPGVTVTKKSGHFQLDTHEILLEDLPGAYSLTSTTLEERVTRDYLLNSPPDAIINVVDGGNLYRGLGLTLQLATSGLPMVVVVNMMDEVRAKGIEIDFDAFSEHLGIPVLPLIARSGEGLTNLKHTLLSVLKQDTVEHPPHISFPPILEEAISELARKVERQVPTDLDQNFIAIRLMEGGDSASRLVERHPALEPLASEAMETRLHVEQHLPMDLPMVCAQCRFNAVRGLIQESVKMPPQLPKDMTARLDRVLMNRWLGLPLFFLIMLMMFQGVFTFGTPLQEALAVLFENIDGWLRTTAMIQALPELGQSLLLDGLLSGSEFPADHHSVFSVPVDHRGQWLYGPGGLPDGSTHALATPGWQSLYQPVAWLRLQCAGGDGNADFIESAQSPACHAAGAIHTMQCPLAGISVPVRDSVCTNSGAMDRIRSLPPEFQHDYFDWAVTSTFSLWYSRTVYYGITAVSATVSAHSGVTRLAGNSRLSLPGLNLHSNWCNCYLVSHPFPRRC